MAITLHDSPDLYTPVNNPMRFVISSTNSGQTNFRYVVDVYTSGVSGYTRLLYPPDPTTGKAAPDISGVMRPQISFDLSDTAYGFQLCNNSYKAYEVKFGEQYGATSGVVNYTDLTVTGTKYAWNGVVSSETFRTFDYSLYTTGGGSACLTNQAETLYFNQSSENEWLYFINDTSGSVYFCQIKTYDENNVLLGTYHIENAYQASSSYLHKLLRVGVGYEDLNNATLYSGSQPVMTSNVDHYTVHLHNYAGVNTSPTYTYYKECNWKGFAAVTLVFLNRLGGFDKFNFRLSRRFYSDIERETFQKNLGEVTGTSWGYAATDRGKTIHNTQITDRWILESDWINNTQAIWLQELIESPEVYYQSNAPIPVIVRNSTTEIKSTGIEKLFNLQIEIEFANKRTTQGA